MTPENLGVDTKFFAMSQPEEKILAFFFKSVIWVAAILDIKTNGMMFCRQTDFKMFTGNNYDRIVDKILKFSLMKLVKWAVWVIWQPYWNFGSHNEYGDRFRCPQGSS